MFQCCNGVWLFYTEILGGNCLREYDFLENEIRQVGQLGNGKGKSLRPSGLAYRDERWIYKLCDKRLGPI